MTDTKGITTQFSPVLAIQTLRDNAVEIEQIGKEIENKKLQLIVALSKLKDAEKQARKDVFTKEIKASLARDYIKLMVAEEQKIYSILKEEVKMLEDRSRIIVEVNNSLKASFKIHELEARNLSLN